MWETVWEVEGALPSSCTPCQLKAHEPKGGMNPCSDPSLLPPPGLLPQRHHLGNVRYSAR